MPPSADLLPLPSALVYPLADNQRLVQILSDVTGKPRDKVRAILYREERDLMSYGNEEFHRRGLQPHVWSDALADYYAQSDAFLFAGVVWNRNPNKLAMRRWIGKFLRRDQPREARVLAFGDGPGFDSLYLAQCGYDVTYFEVSPRLLDFAQKVFALSECTVRAVRAEQEIERGAYDVVLCLDVLEHVPDPPGLVAQLARYLRPGGRLIVNAPFYFVSARMPTHLKSNLRYSGSLRRLYKPHGLRLLDGHWSWAPLVLGNAARGTPLPTSRGRRLLLRLCGLPHLLARVCPALLFPFAHAAWKGDPSALEGLEPEGEAPTPS